MNVKISVLDDVPEIVENVSSWSVTDHETLRVTTVDGETIVYNSAAWLRLEEIS